MSTALSGVQMDTSSPLAKLRRHARAVKGIITDSQPGRHDLEDIYVDAAVVLTTPDASLVDPSGRNAPTLIKAAAFFQNNTCIPAEKSKTPQNVAKPPSEPLPL
jgi:hypothetical protein